MALQSFNLDEAAAAAEKELREQQELALRDRRAGEATVNPVVGSALQGATFGFGDEATAGVRSLFGSTDYDTALAQERAGVAKFRDENPVSDFALNVGGSLVPSLVGGRVLRGLRGEPTTAPPPGAPGGGFNPFAGPRTVSPNMPPPMPPAVPALAGLGPTVKSAAMVGAGQGALQGFGEGEGLGGRLAGGAIGGAFGHVLGGVGGGIAHGLSEGAQYLTKPMLWARGGNAAAEGARDKIIQNATRSGTDIDGMAADLARQQSGRADLLGQGFPDSGLTLGERMGPSVTPAMDAAAQMPGVGSTQIRTQLTTRQEGRQDRVGQGLRAVFGDLEDDYVQRQRLRTERSADADPLFKNAWDNSRPLEPIDMRNLGRVPSEIFAEARKAARMEGRTVDFEPTFDKDGFMNPLKAGEVPPSPEDYHRVKGSLTDFINDHTQPDGTMDSLAHHAKTVRDAIKARLNEITTDENGVSHYQKAMDAWSEPSAEMAASKLGKGAANMNGSELEHRISTMSVPERQAFAAGFFGDLRERLSKVDVTGNANPVRAVFRDEKQRNAVNTALSALGISEDEANRRMGLLTQFFGDEMAGSRVEGQIQRGSQTAQRQAWMKDLATPAITGGALGGLSLARGDDPTTALLAGLGGAGIGALSRTARQGIASRGTEHMNNAMLQMLGLTDPGAQTAALAALRDRAMQTRMPPPMAAPGGVAGQIAGPRIGSATGLTGGLAGLISPAPIDDPRFQPQ